MGLKVFGVLDECFRIDDRDQRFGGEVARLFSLRGREGGFDLVVLAKLGLDVVVETCDLLLSRV